MTADADARRRAWDHAQKRRELDEERQAMTAVLTALNEDERRASQRLQAEQAECATLRRSIESTRDSVERKREQNRALEFEVAQSNTRVDIARRRAERLQADIESLRREVEAARERVAQARRSVDKMSGSVLRMDYKMRR